MFFLSSKILWFLLAPSNALTFAAVFGVALAAFGWRTFGLSLAGLALGLILVLGLTPVADLLLRPLENRFPRFEGPPPDGIVVLGGSVSTSVSGSRETIALNESAERMTAMVGLAIRYPEAEIVFTGGSNAILGDAVTEAEIAKRFFAQSGLDPARLVVEGRSRNTAENAAFTKAVVDPRPGERWLLVTSAYHMPRAVGVFRAAGFPVEAYPVDYRTGGGDGLEGFASVADGLKRADTAFKEWVGLVAYRLTRRTDALFPAP